MNTIAGIRTRIPGSLLTGADPYRLPNHASFCFPGISGEAVLLELERRGVVCSSGSACAAGRDEPSHVLIALGIPAEVARTAVRFTLPADADERLADRIVDLTADAVAAVGALSPR